MHPFSFPTSNEAPKRGLGQGLPSTQLEQAPAKPLLRQPSGLFDVTSYEAMPEISLSLDFEQIVKNPELKLVPSLLEENFHLQPLQPLPTFRPFTELPYLGLPLPTTVPAPPKLAASSDEEQRPNKKRQKRIPTKKQPQHGKTTYKMLIGDTWYHVPNGYMLVRNTLI